MSNDIVAWPAGIVTLAGNERTAGLLLDSDTIVPPAGAAAFSPAMPYRNALSPLAVLALLSWSETRVGGVAGILKLRTVDHAVTAALIGEASPSHVRTRQYLVPLLSDVTVYCEAVRLRTHSSIDPQSPGKVESP